MEYLYLPNSALLMKFNFRFNLSDFRRQEFAVWRRPWSTWYWCRNMKQKPSQCARALTAKWNNIFDSFYGKKHIALLQGADQMAKDLNNDLIKIRTDSKRRILLKGPSITSIALIVAQISNTNFIWRVMWACI